MNQKFTSTRELADALKSDISLQNKFKEDPVSAIESIKGNPLGWDTWVYRIVVLALGITVLSVVIGVIFLLATNTNPSNQQMLTILTATASAALGALAGLLVPPPRT